MSNQLLPIQFAVTSEEALVWFMGGVFALLFGAMGLDYLRRKQNQRRQLDSMWRLAEELLREKELSSAEQEYLLAMLRRHMPRQPLQAVTVRRQFNECVDKEMKSLNAAGASERLKEVGILLREIRVRLGLEYVPIGQRIFSTRELNIPQVVFVAPSVEGPPRWTRCNMLAIDEAQFHVSPGDRTERLSSFASGMTVRCHLWHEDDARYDFQTTLVQASGAPPGWSLLHATDLRRVQARNYFRIRYNQETNIGILPSSAEHNTEEISSQQALTQFHGRISNLSAGGLAVVTQHAVNTRAYLRVSLAIPHEKPFETEVTIVGVQPLAGGRHLLRAQFVGLNEDEQDIIARYVLQSQRPIVTPGDRVAMRPAEAYESQPRQSEPRQSEPRQSEPRP